VESLPHIDKESSHYLTPLPPGILKHLGFVSSLESLCTSGASDSESMSSRIWNKRLSPGPGIGAKSLLSAIPEGPTDISDQIKGR